MQAKFMWQKSVEKLETEKVLNSGLQNIQYKSSSVAIITYYSHHCVLQGIKE
jgi:hypothetical protein